MDLGEMIFYLDLAGKQRSRHFDIRSYIEAEFLVEDVDPPHNFS
jgi:hypothetical protein